MEVETFLRKRARVGKSCVVVAHDSLGIPEFKNHPKVFGMYERYGWKKFSADSGLMYRSPKRVPAEVLKKLKAEHTRS